MIVGYLRMFAKFCRSTSQPICVSYFILHAFQGLHEARFTKESVGRVVVGCRNRTSMVGANNDNRYACVRLK